MIYKLYGKVNNDRQQPGSCLRAMFCRSLVYNLFCPAQIPSKILFKKIFLNKTVSVSAPAPLQHVSSVLSTSFFGGLSLGYGVALLWAI